jgi:chromosome segregation ATPase
MSTVRFLRNGAGVEVEKCPPVLRLMQSVNREAVEAVRSELVKAGIGVECRNNPVADSLGITALELWLQDERDFLSAAEVYARTMEGFPAARAETGPPPLRAQGDRKRGQREPQAANLEQASSLLEQEIEGMLKRERELLAEGAALRGKVTEMERALAEARAALARETDSRTAAERSQVEKLSRLEGALEGERAARIFAEEQLGREQREWQQVLKARDEALKEKENQLEAKERLLENQQAAVEDLRTALESLAAQREEADKALSEAREEAARERAARLAAEQAAQRAVAAQQALERQLADRQRLEEQLQAHLAGINALRTRLQTTRAELVEV